MNKKLLTIIAIILIVVASYAGYSIYSNSSESKFIIVNPINGNQIYKISKFRSCVGSDYSGYNTDMELEDDRSMKHYLEPKTEFLNSNSMISVYSPFDGLITDVVEEGEREGYQVSLSPKSAQSYTFVFFHIKLIEGLIKNTEVTAGQQIGYALLESNDRFDIALKKYVSGEENQIMESPFDHMKASVLSEYTKRGLELEDLTISKKDRDRIPCTFGVGSGQDEWIILK